MPGGCSSTATPCATRARTARRTFSWWQPRKLVHCARMNRPPWKQAESDPLGAASRPAERLQCLRASLQVDDHSRCYLPPALRCGAGAVLADRMVGYGNFGTPSNIQKRRQRGRTAGKSIRSQEKKCRNDRRTSSILSILRAPIRLAMSEGVHRKQLGCLHHRCLGKPTFREVAAPRDAPRSGHP